MYLVQNMITGCLEDKLLWHIWIFRYLLFFFYMFEYLAYNLHRKYCVWFVCRNITSLQTGAAVAGSLALFWKCLPHINRIYRSGCNIYCTGLLESARKQKREKNYEEAEQHAMQVLQQEPNNASAMSLLSAIHGDCGRWDKAKYFGQKAIEQDPRHAAAHCNLGWTYHNNGQVQKAVTHYKKSLEVGLLKTAN